MPSFFFFFAFIFWLNYPFGFVQLPIQVSDCPSKQGVTSTSFPGSLSSPHPRGSEGRKTMVQAGHVSLHENKIPGRGLFVQRPFVKFKARPFLICQDLLTGVPSDNFFRIEPFSAKMICECLQTDFWLIVNLRGKNLSALQSQLAINLTFVVASQNPFYQFIFPRQEVLLK